MTTKTQALLELCPGAEWCMKDDVIVKWYSSSPQQPTEEEIQAKLKELQAEYDSQAYARNRKEEYPPTADQLDYMYHNGFEKWKTDIIDPVKDKYPKG